MKKEEEKLDQKMSFLVIFRCRPYSRFYKKNKKRDPIFGAGRAIFWKFLEVNKAAKVSFGFSWSRCM